MVYVVFKHNTHYSGIALQFAVAVEKIGIVEMSLKLAYVSEEFVHTAFVGSRYRAFVAACPFSEHAGRVAVAFHIFGQYDMTGVVWFLAHYRIVGVSSVHYGVGLRPIFPVAAHMAVAGVLACHQRCTRWGAYRRSCVCLCEQYAV